MPEEDDDKNTLMLSIETDKLTESFAMRIPEITKRKLDKLSPKDKKSLNEALLITIARVLHEADFAPGKYLKEKG